MKPELSTGKKFTNPSDEERCRLLKQVRNIAVIGLSPDPSRDSHWIAKGLKKEGYHVIPVNPEAGEILGEKTYARLADVPEPIDLVNVFRRAQYVDGIVDDCLSLGLEAIWIQSGIVNEAATLRALAGGMTVVMDRCIYHDLTKVCR
ncbi:MAG: CoA-binding protein [Burkholderiales bacterium]